MKTIFRVLTLGAMMTATAAVSVFAQDVCTEVEAKQALYKQFTDNIPSATAKKTLDEQEVAVQAGKQYVDKYGACADDKQIVDYLKTNVPAMEKYIAETKAKNIIIARNERFDAAVKASNTSGIYSSGKEILAAEPDFLDVTIALASAGFDQVVANPPVDTYNSDVINYAKTAIQQLEANKPSKTGDYGVLQYSYETPKYKGRNNALGLLNYDIGYILYYRQGKDNPAKKKEALPYLYKSTQYDAYSKTNPAVYQAIGAWYLDEAIRLDSERTAALAKNNNVDNDETLAMLGMQKGFADRSIDAYARAYSLAKADPKQNKTYTDGLYTKLKQLYQFRYDNKTEGVDAFVASVMSKPLPDPTTEITPVKVEAAPATTITTTSGTVKPSAMTSDDNSASTTNTGKGTGTKTATTSGGTTKTGGAATTKTPVKAATTPKKKGTR